MIRPSDFEVEFAGPVVRVTHRPTGARREAAVRPGEGGKVRDRLIAELERRVFRPEDFVVDLLCAEGGSFLVARHVPSGRRGEPAAAASGPRERELLAALVEALVRDGTIRPE